MMDTPLCGPHANTSIMRCKISYVTTFYVYGNWKLEISTQIIGLKNPSIKSYFQSCNRLKSYPSIFSMYRCLLGM